MSATELGASASERDPAQAPECKRARTMGFARGINVGLSLATGGQMIREGKYARAALSFAAAALWIEIERMERT